MSAADDRGNPRVLLRRFPEGVPVVEDFEYSDGQRPTAGAGEFVSQTLYLSLDPYLRGVISGKHMYADKVSPGDVMPGRSISRVSESNHPDYQPGDIVFNNNGWQAFGISDGSEVRKVDPGMAPISTALGILGMPGLTAYAGLLFLAQPRGGETVVVSAASGPVGCMVGQIAKIKGCRTVGIAGTDQKCAAVVDEFGFDACINYKTSDLRSELKKHCPDGIDIYFDNVAGDTLAAVLTNLHLGARIVLCGMITQYNQSGAPPPGPNLGPIVGARATMHGLVVYDHNDRFDEFLTDAAAWLEQGLLHYREDVTEGLEHAPEAFSRLMRGENFGKTLVKLSG